MANEELLYRISMLEQEAKKVEEDIKSLNGQITEFESLKLSLASLDKDILAGLGKGVYFKSKAEDSNLLVNVGCNILVKKNKAQTSQLVDKQIKNIEELKLKLLEHIELLNKEMGNLISSVSG